MSHLISPRELQGELESGRPVRLLDVRWRLDLPEGRPEYVAGHLPGAVYVDLERELSKRGYPEDGRYPLPDVEALEASVQRWGIRTGELVVVYDDNDAVAAARAWWLLRRRGLEVRVLDGGLRAWVGHGYAHERGDFAPSRGNARLTAADPGAVTMDEAARAPVEGYLIDVRAPEHYRGLAPGLDPVAGHIPGALNIPVIAHIARDGTFRSPAEIRAVLDAFGVDPSRPITLYCGAGISSAHSALAYAEAGIETRIYPGSWSQWSRSPRRPVAVGRTPADALQSW